MIALCKQGYQKWISPILPRVFIDQPARSLAICQAVEKHGARRWRVDGGGRICRCQRHPLFGWWSRSGSPPICHVETEQGSRKKIIDASKTDTAELEIVGCFAL